MYYPARTSSLTSPVGNFIRLPVLRRTFLLLWPATISLLPLHAACAVSPPPDGGYAGNNTADRDSALLALTTGRDGHMPDGGSSELLLAGALAGIALLRSAKATRCTSWPVT
jgi:hypothetical protein